MGDEDDRIKIGLGEVCKAASREPEGAENGEMRLQAQGADWDGGAMRSDGRIYDLHLKRGPVSPFHPDLKSDACAYVHSGSRADVYLHTDACPNPYPHTDPCPDTGPDSHADTGPDSHADAGPDSHADARPDSYADARPDSYADAVTPPVCGVDFFPLPNLPLPRYTTRANY